MIQWADCETLIRLRVWSEFRCPLMLRRPRFRMALLTYSDQIIYVNYLLNIMWRKSRILKKCQHSETGILLPWAATSENVPVQTWAPSEDSDQPAHSRSLTRIFTGQSGKVSSCGQRRLWSDCVDAQADLSLRWAHLWKGMFSNAAAHKRAAQCENMSTGICGKRRPRSACASTVW